MPDVQTNTISETRQTVRKNTDRNDEYNNGDIINNNNNIYLLSSQTSRYLDGTDIRWQLKIYGYVDIWSSIESRQMDKGKDNFAVYLSSTFLKGCDIFCRSNLGHDMIPYSL